MLKLNEKHRTRKVLEDRNFLWCRNNDKFCYLREKLGYRHGGEAAMRDRIKDTWEN